MNLELLKENLNNPLAIASRYISTRPALPVLANILFEADQHGLTLSSTNLDTTVHIHLPAQTQTEGKTTIPARAVYEFVNMLPAGKIKISEQDNQLTIASGDSQASFNTISTDDFPILPKFNQDNAIGLPINVVKEVAEQVLFAASTDESRPVLTSLYLKKQADTITFVATDGYRLSEVTRPAQGAQIEDGKVLLLPAKIIAELLRLTTTEKADTLWIDITTQSNQLALKVDQVEFFSKLINGNYPPYERIIPKDFTTTIDLDSDELFQAIKLSTIFARDSGSQVKFTVKPDQGIIEVSAQSSTLGKNKTAVAVKGEGVETEISFNAKFLTDVLNVAKGQITLKFKTSDSPLLIESPSLPNFKHIVMPLKV